MATRARGRLLPRQDPEHDRGLRPRRRRRYPGPHHRAPPGAVHSRPAGGDRPEHGGRGRRARRQFPQSRRARWSHDLDAGPVLVRGRDREGAGHRVRSGQVHLYRQRRRVELGGLCPRRHRHQVARRPPIVAPHRDLRVAGQHHPDRHGAADARRPRHADQGRGRLRVDRAGAGGARAGRGRRRVHGFRLVCAPAGFDRQGDRPTDPAIDRSTTTRSARQRTKRSPPPSRI